MATAEYLVSDTTPWIAKLTRLELYMNTPLKSALKVAFLWNEFYLYHRLSHLHKAQGSVETEIISAHPDSPQHSERHSLECITVNIFDCIMKASLKMRACFWNWLLSALYLYWGNMAKISVNLGKSPIFCEIWCLVFDNLNPTSLKSCLF